jgi:predicted nucleic acid-binding Zn ribbon protein
VSGSCPRCGKPTPGDEPYQCTGDGTHTTLRPRQTFVANHVVLAVVIALCALAVVLAVAGYFIGR